MRSVDGKTCTGPCGEALPLAQFAKDVRRKDGHRSACKTCDRKATAARRADRRIGRRPGALVLAPKFPAPPEIPSPLAVVASAPISPTEKPGGAGSYLQAAERQIAALVPPAGDADALLIRNLRGLAELADHAAYRADPDDPVRELTALTGAMVRVQRELAATRAARAKAEPEAAPAPRSAANY